MNIRPTLAEASLLLEKAISSLPTQTGSPAELYDRYEEIAIEILDSEFSNYVPGALEEYLQTYLYLKKLELGLVEFPDPQEA